MIQFEPHQDFAYFEALKAIAEMSITPTTNFAQLSALCIAIARETLGYEPHPPPDLLKAVIQAKASTR